MAKKIQREKKKKGHIPNVMGTNSYMQKTFLKCSWTSKILGTDIITA